MIRSILAAAESSERCTPPLAAAAHLAKRYGATLEILHAAPAGAPPIAILGAQLAAVCNAVLAAQPAGIRIAEGSPAEAIHRQALASGVDLVVMGPHRQAAGGAVGRLGSTAEAVLARLDIPVMIVPLHGRLEAAGYDTILAAVDFSPTCAAALRWAVGLPDAPAAALHLFHMLPVPPFPKYTRAAYAADTAEALERLERFGREHAAGHAYALEVGGGAQPGHDILRQALQVEADLVVLGSHTRDRRGKWYAGSVVREVSAGAACPVVAVGLGAAPCRTEDPSEAAGSWVRVFSGAEDNKVFKDLQCRARDIHDLHSHGDYIPGAIDHCLFEAIGKATAIDSLAAVKHLIFDGSGLPGTSS
jgi:nucleotide-binding universal stress UspA family protein